MVSHLAEWIGAVLAAGVIAGLVGLAAAAAGVWWLYRTLRRRVEAVKALRVFDDRMYFDQVYAPVLAALGVSRQELRKAA